MKIQTDWLDIPNAAGYQVNYKGEVRRIYKRANPKILSQWVKDSKWLFVKVKINGIFKDIAVHKLMSMAFKLDGIGPIVYHVNGCTHDNHVNNLRYITRKELGKLTGAKSNRKPVARTNGIDIVYYSSARAAAKNNYCSHQTVTDACNGKTKSNCTGYQFAWA